MLAVFALVVAACAQDTEDTEDTTADTEAPTATETTAAPTPTETTMADDTTTETTMAEEMLTLGPGVTEEPCEGGNPDNGCIYLGVLTDESGPFAGASGGLYGGQSLFWATVNAEVRTPRSSATLPRARSSSPPTSMNRVAERMTSSRSIRCLAIGQS